MNAPLKYFILFLLAAALLPYFIICFYTLPFADDFCFGWTASAHIPFLQKFLNQYLLWNGRYTADVLVNLHPLITSRLIYYQLVVFVSLFAMPLVLWWFISEVLKHIQAFNTSASDPTELPAHTTLIISLLITLFYLNYQPNLTEGIYWFIGIANYHWGLLFFLLHLTLLLKSLRVVSTAINGLRLISLVLLVISIGFNEVGALLIPLFYALIFLLSWRASTLNKRIILLCYTIALTASAFVFFSPGNFGRTGIFENRYNFWHSLWQASQQTVRFTGTWFLSLPFVLLSLLTLAHAAEIRSRFIKHLDYRLLFGFTLFTVFTGSFLPYFATGVLGQHRTINFVFFFFILLWLLLLVKLADRFALKTKLQFLSSPKARAALLIVSIIIIAGFGKGADITRNLMQGNYSAYKSSFFERQQAMIKNPGAPIQKLAVIPAPLTIVDVKSDTAWWVDLCVKKLYIESKIEIK